MALKVLLIDQAADWLKEARGVLEAEGYEVDSCTNGKDAQLQMYNNRYFSVVLNLEVENHPGLQVMKFIKVNCPSIRVVNIIESEDFFAQCGANKEELKKMGVTDLLERPFEISELVTRLEGGQGYIDIRSRIVASDTVSEETEVEQNDFMFTSIKIDMFHSEKVVLFDVFVKLAAKKYIKILHAGDSFSPERIDKYRTEKKVEFLYFLVKDRNKYIRFYNHLSTKYLLNKTSASGKKFKLMKDLTEKLLEEVASVGLKPIVIDQGKEVCNNFFNMVENDENLWKIVQHFSDLDPTAYSHSYLVCLYSSMVVKQFEWESKVIIETIALASIFHDIGMSKINLDLLKMRPSEMSEAQLAEYKTHPQEGAKMLEGNHLISASVKQIVLQHHEASNGMGFPFGIRDMKILTLAKIVFLANEFAHFVIDNEIKPLEGLRRILTTPELASRYNAVVLEQFMKIFVDPQKIKKVYGARGGGTVNSGISKVS